jgi:hypothetical protein
LKARTKAIVARGERRISATRAHVAKCGEELRTEIDRLYEAERTLTSELTRLRGGIYRLTAENERLRFLNDEWHALLDEALSGLKADTDVSIPAPTKRATKEATP